MTSGAGEGAGVGVGVLIRLGIDVGGGRRGIGIAVGDTVVATVGGRFVIAVAVGDGVAVTEMGSAVEVSVFCVSDSSGADVIAVGSVGCSLEHEDASMYRHRAAMVIVVMTSRYTE